MASEDVENALAESRSTLDQDVTEALEKEVSAKPTGVRGWINRLPKNMGVGVYRAALNTIETIDDVFEAGAELIMTPPPIVQIDAALKGKTLPEREIDPIPPLQTTFPGVFEAAHNFADEAEVSNTFSDDLTQGIAQFVIPFVGYLKALGGIKHVETLIKVERLALAEGVTAASAFEAHEGRMADVVEMGRQMENNFGAVLNKVSPDGSAANAYINWMTDKENESQMKGRFKNALDSLVATGGIVTVLKAIGLSLKAARSGVSKLKSVDPVKLQGLAIIGTGAAAVTAVEIENRKRAEAEEAKDE